MTFIFYLSGLIFYPYNLGHVGSVWKLEFNMEYVQSDISFTFAT